MPPKRSLLNSIPFYQAIAGALLICSIILLVRVWKLRESFARSSAYADPAAVETLVSSALRTAQGKRVVIADGGARYAVLYVFTASDCPACLDELRDLSQVSTSRRDERVYAMMSYANGDEMEQTRENFGILYPILADPDGAIVARLHVPQTPWKIVVDLPEKKILLEDPPGETAEERVAFLDRLARLPAE